MKAMKNLPLICLAVPFLFVFSGAVSNTAVGQPIMLTHQVMLEIDADPWAMAAAGNDSSMIVAGSSGHHDAWAAKFDMQGQRVWNYTIGLQDEIKYPVPDSAKFHGAVSMPDGSAFLCGVMPRPQGSTASSLMLVHLDANGHALSEAFLSPDSRTNPGVQAHGAWACVGSGDGVVVLAQVWRVIRPAGVPPILERFCWVFEVDRAGQIKWQTQIPILLGNGFYPTAIALASSGSGLIISASNSQQTELVTMDRGGAVKSHREIPGRFILLRSIPMGGAIQLFGTLDKDLQPVVVTLDDDLVEVSRIQGHYPNSFRANVAYSTQGGSIALFGAAVHDRGANYATLVVSADRSLKTGQNLELPRARRPFIDGWFIQAAAPSGRAGEFVVARRIVTPQDPPKVMTQLELDYLQFK
jgi:hypothetical protein